jgi:hypothetical protein
MKVNRLCTFVHAALIILQNGVLVMNCVSYAIAKFKTYADTRAVLTLVDLVI